MHKAIITFLSLAVSLVAFAQNQPDKPALEKFFMEGLARYDSPVPRPLPDTLQRIGKDLYVSDCGHYESEQVRAVSYFRRVKGYYLPLRDRSLPAESVATLLSGYTGSSHYKVCLKQHRYNYALEEVEVPLDRLLGFCIMECGFMPFVGIESTSDTRMKAVLFLVNSRLGYSHTFLFTIDLDILSQDTGLLQAEAYTFTPIHNLAR